MHTDTTSPLHCSGCQLRKRHLDRFFSQNQEKNHEVFRLFLVFRLAAAQKSPLPTTFFAMVEAEDSVLPALVVARERSGLSRRKPPVGADWWSLLRPVRGVERCLKKSTVERGVPVCPVQAITMAKPCDSKSPNPKPNTPVKVESAAAMDLILWTQPEGESPAATIARLSAEVRRAEAQRDQMEAEREDAEMAAQRAYREADQFRMALGEAQASLQQTQQQLLAAHQAQVQAVQRATRLAVARTRPVLQALCKEVVALMEEEDQ